MTLNFMAQNDQMQLENLYPVGTSNLFPPALLYIIQYNNQLKM